MAWQTMAWCGLLRVKSGNVHSFTCCLQLFSPTIITRAYNSPEIKDVKLPNKSSNTKRRSRLWGRLPWRASNKDIGAWIRMTAELKVTPNLYFVNYTGSQLVCLFSAYAFCKKAWLTVCAVHLYKTLISVSFMTEAYWKKRPIHCKRNHC